MEENTEQTTEETVEEEKAQQEDKHCYHKFVKFKNYRRCIKCGMEIDK